MIDKLAPERNYCVIMAGGMGSRFWPESRNSRPKQFSLELAAVCYR